MEVIGVVTLSAIYTPDGILVDGPFGLGEIPWATPDSPSEPKSAKIKTLDPTNIDD